MKTTVFSAIHGSTMEGGFTMLQTNTTTIPYESKDFVRRYLRYLASDFCWPQALIQNVGLDPYRIGHQLLFLMGTKSRWGKHHFDL